MALLMSGLWFLLSNADTRQEVCKPMLSRPYFPREYLLDPIPGANRVATYCFPPSSLSMSRLAVAVIRTVCGFPPRQDRHMTVALTTRRRCRSMQRRSRSISMSRPFRRGHISSAGEREASMLRTRYQQKQIHVDQTPESALARIYHHLPHADAEALARTHYQIINLWRPIKHAADDWPLALCDFRSVDRARDLVPMTLKFPDRIGEAFGVQHNDAHRWKYVRGMTPEEGVLIKCFDSIGDGSVSILTPHTAFEDPTTPEGVPKRESIELRALVFYE
ncbi:hypothetical protein BV25DRAFT_1670594 [Artomyces pyxidatus]|uniref:Uncharacterized protein n=1 Tax=Artomyces pyxidatus TaxID=48021 RepID=A0ACB8SJ61_9AGAM|nr:hypothetical protein BV25DRAFT_1670594 [Artomyces pyxidatus]